MKDIGKIRDNLDTALDNVKGEYIQVCDVCERTEISLIIAGESSELLPMRYDSSTGLWICEICDEGKV